MTVTDIDLLVTGATVVTCDEDQQVIYNGGLVVKNGRIEQIGTDKDLAPFKDKARQVLELNGSILMPGLINLHCHAADSLFRGLVENLPLEPWLQKVWKAEAAIVKPDTVRLGSRLGFAELLLAGTTTVVDMFFYPEEIAAAAHDLGIRTVCGPVFMLPPGLQAAKQKPPGQAADDFLSDYQNDPLVTPALMPHGCYTVEPDVLVKAYELAEKYDALFTIHAAETIAEQETVTSRYGRSVIRHLDHLGLLGPKSLLAHCVVLDDEEIEILSDRKATVAHNPVSNLKLGSGLAPIPDFLTADICVGLGTDGAISGNDLDPWLSMRLAALLPRGDRRQADLIPGEKALEMATRNGAMALGKIDQLGSLEAGKAADFIVVEMSGAHAIPCFDPITHLVFSASRSDVRDVFIAGEQVVKDRRLTRCAIEETLDEVRTLTPTIAATLA